MPISQLYNIVLQMFLFKRLDRFILGKFVLIFMGAFFICLFVFMMQFTWKYVDELIGKGLTLDVLARFFYYMGITLVPNSLPLAVLLASLITFGNMGEQLELLAMKAAGVSLFRIMAPIGVFVAMLTATSFYFQNYTSPAAQLQLRTLLFSMKASSPAVEIPEGVFYTDKIPNINLYVQSKNAETGMLYQVIIYKTDQGFDRAQIVLADSGRLAVTADKQHLTLRLWQGEMFENLQGQSAPGLTSTGVPYDRETFIQKDFIIDFDSNFKEMDANQLAGMAQAKSMTEIETSVDSMQHRLDSIGKEHFDFLKRSTFRTIHLTGSDSLAYLALTKREHRSFDELLSVYSNNQQTAVEQSAAMAVAQQRADLEFRRDMTADTEGMVRRHWIEWHQKITYSLACLMFFFVGAPLGGIIRKGGLGMPTVISVGIFIVYYIINTSGMKLGRDGTINIAFGMWISTAILTPIGLFLTYKSNNDSVVFNAEVYQRFCRNLLGLRPKRFLTRKEVIISPPDYTKALGELDQIKAETEQLLQIVGKRRFTSYWQLFFKPMVDDGTPALADHLEAFVTELSNSQNHRIVETLNGYPQFFKREHIQIMRRHRANKILGIFFPIGVVLWARTNYFLRKLKNDCKKTLQVSEQLQQLLRNEIKNKISSGHS